LNLDAVGATLLSGCRFDPPTASAQVKPAANITGKLWDGLVTAWEADKISISVSNFSVHAEMPCMIRCKGGREHAWLLRGKPVRCMLSCASWRVCHDERHSGRHTRVTRRFFAADDHRRGTRAAVLGLSCLTHVGFPL
jgi:hypothetical protein